MNTKTATSSPEDGYKSQPLILDIKNISGEDRKVTLFDAVHRAFDFDNMTDPFTEITGPYASYKTICNYLAGCQDRKTGYVIGRIEVHSKTGEFPHIDQKKKGLMIGIEDNDINGNCSKIYITLEVKESQIIKSIIKEDTNFSFTNITSITIETVPPHSHFRLYLWPVVITTIFHKREYELPKIEMSFKLKTEGL